MKRRTFLALGAAGAVAPAFGADGALERDSRADSATMRAVIPPGGRSLHHLTGRCTACGLCVAACPEKAIRPSGPFAYGIAGMMMPRMDFKAGYCRPDCAQCAKACPAGALLRLSPGEKERTRIGAPVFIRENCVVVKDDVDCCKCASECPRKAIVAEKPEGSKRKLPKIDPALCVGCGRCENFCPGAPKAIRVQGLRVHEFSLKAGETLFAVRADGTEFSSDVRGVKPLLDALEPGSEARLAGARAFDRVVGRAAAFIYVALGVKSVWGAVASEGAKKLLAAHGISFSAEKIVPAICNRKDGGPCPMDEAVSAFADNADPAAAVAALRARLAEMVN